MTTQAANDANLACPPRHIDDVFEMLERQPRRPRFTGGLQASLITPAIARRLVELRFDIAYTAFDQPGQGPWVERAVKLLREAGGWSLRRSQRKIGCYVLCGCPGDTRRWAEHRLRWVTEMGATPFPMFYQGPNDRKDPKVEQMKRAMRRWMRPARMFSRRTGPKRERGLFSAASVPSVAEGR